MAGMLRAVVPAVCFMIMSVGAATPADTKVDLELVIAVDVSGSMDQEEFALQREGYVAAIRHPDFIGAILAGEYQRIGLTYVE